ncbi:unnamed protein product, partial [Trichogramma brassicae]
LGSQYVRLLTQRTNDDPNIIVESFNKYFVNNNVQNISPMTYKPNTHLHQSLLDKNKLDGRCRTCLNESTDKMFDIFADQTMERPYLPCWTSCTFVKKLGPPPGPAWCLWQVLEQVPPVAARAHVVHSGERPTAASCASAPSRRPTTCTSIAGRISGTNSIGNYIARLPALGRAGS